MRWLSPGSTVCGTNNLWQLLLVCRRGTVRACLVQSCHRLQSVQSGLGDPDKSPLTPTFSLLLSSGPVFSLLLPTSHSFTRECRQLVLCVQRPAPASLFSSKRKHKLDQDGGARQSHVDRGERARTGREKVKQTTSPATKTSNTNIWLVLFLATC